MLKALDLFCCAGGSSDGLVRAGFKVTGIDIEAQEEYPYDFIQKDATKLSIKFLRQFDFIWASPPCQQFTRAKHLRNAQGYKTKALNLIPITRKLLQKAGVPFVIENVKGAPLREDVLLCGSSFGLKVRRHRVFECSFEVEQLPCKHKEQGKPIGVYHRMKDKIPHGGHTAETIKQARKAMGTNRMSWNKLKESVPPIYAYHIAKCFLSQKNKKERKENSKVN